MTPKEKAEELINKIEHCPPQPAPEKMTITIHPEAAKQCALICVEEIMNQFPEMTIELSLENSLDLIPHRNYTFWKEVKEEINNYNA